jgi:L-rhamnose mutarotase
MPHRHCLTLDLKDDPALIAAYRRHHEHVWPEVLHSLRNAGIVDAEIYLFETRMVLILDVNDDFSFDTKASADAADPTVQAWETLMWTFQQPLPGTPPGEKWRLMERVFQLNSLG